jgi:acyl-CoA dehydrogenase
MVEMATELSLAQTFLDDLTNKHIQGENIVTQISMAKWFITEMTRRISSRCLQLHGGYGFMEEYPIARRYRDVAVMPIYGGTTEIMKNIIAKNLGL